MIFPWLFLEIHHTNLSISSRKESESENFYREKNIFFIEKLTLSIDVFGITSQSGVDVFCFINFFAGNLKPSTVTFNMSTS